MFAAAPLFEYESGKAQQYEYQHQAEQEKMAAKDREIERRNRLLKALAQRNVASAAGGSSLEGTPLALVKRDFREFSLESLSAKASTAAKVSGLRAAGVTAKRLGTINAVASLFDTAKQAYGAGG